MAIRHIDCNGNVCNLHHTPRSALKNPVRFAEKRPYAWIVQHTGNALIKYAISALPRECQLCHKIYEFCQSSVPFIHPFVAKTSRTDAYQAAEPLAETKFTEKLEMPGDLLDGESMREVRQFGKCSLICKPGTVAAIDHTSTRRLFESPNSFKWIPNLSSSDKYRLHILRFG